MITRMAADADSVGTLVAVDVGDGVGGIVGDGVGGIVGEGVGDGGTMVAVGLGGSVVTGGAAVHAAKTTSNDRRASEFMGRASSFYLGCCPSCSPKARLF
jgi:hypothetical protein